VADPFSSLRFDDPYLYACNVNARRIDVPVWSTVDSTSRFCRRSDVLLRSHRVAISDVVTATAATLWREAVALRPDALYLPDAVHVADFDPRLAPEVPLPEEDQVWFETDDRPVAIYWGAVAPWLDDRLLVDLARHRPDLRLAVLGPGSERDVAALQAAAPANLRYFGPRPYRRSRAMHGAPRPPCSLRPGDHAGVSPLQLFEYLAARRQSSPPLPEWSAGACSPLMRRRFRRRWTSPGTAPTPSFFPGSMPSSQHDWSPCRGDSRRLKIPGASRRALTVPADLEGAGITHRGAPPEANCGPSC
jgi:hypothetical protein